jgi:NIMA (never in mitosis gene a)-related kinase
MEYADNGDLFQKILEQQKLGAYMKEQEIWNVIT